MAGSVDNANAWDRGIFYSAPKGTTAPVDTSTAFSATWKDAGLLGESGLTEENEKNFTDRFDWSGTLIRSIKGTEKRTFKVTVVEDNDTVFKLTNPGSTSSTATGTTTRVVKTSTRDNLAFAFETGDGTTVSRIIVPSGEITNVGPATRSREDIVSREFTIVAYPASDGTLYREITNHVGAVVA